MDKAQLQKLYTDVFNPQEGESVLFLYDIPTVTAGDTPGWAERRACMIPKWIDAMEGLPVSIDVMSFFATGRSGKELPDTVKQAIVDHNIVLAMTQFSATSSVLPICKRQGSQTRGASMPGILPDMENTALAADYAEVRNYANGLKRIFDDTEGSTLKFSSGHELYIDLRDGTPNERGETRTAVASACDLTQAGTFSNLPSGETFKVPYEAVGDEVAVFGESKTNGYLPLTRNGELVVCHVENNRVTAVLGDHDEAVRLREYFKANPTRKNISEQGIGCNPNAIVRGSVLEDEKAGPHVATSTSAHFPGGKVQSDAHEDEVYARGCPVETDSLVMHLKDGSELELMVDGAVNLELALRYNS